MRATHCRMLAIYERVVIFAVCIIVRKCNFDILISQMNNGIERFTVQFIVQQVF